MIMMIAVLSSPAMANNVSQYQSTDNFTLVSENEFFDDDGNFVVERIYVDILKEVQEGGRATSGEGIYKKTQTVHSINTVGHIEATASGYFVWNSANNMSSVSQPAGTYRFLTNITYYCKNHEESLIYI